MEAGQVIEVPNYPFVRTSWNKPVWDGEGYSEEAYEGWKPGCKSVSDGGYDFDLVADGIGAMILTVVSIHKPGRFPERVFFTRQWRDPDGNVFGNKKLRMATTQTFKRRSIRYLHEFSCEE